MKHKDIKEILIEMSSHGMFPDAACESNFKNGTASEDDFTQRDYKIRPALSEDVATLLQIEEACWGDKMRADKEELLDRIENASCLNFVIEYNGNVVGVIYTQRIKEEDMKKLSSEELKRYRAENGRCIQAVTLNVFPEYQSRGWGYELLEFVLEYCSLLDDIDTVCAVTRCRDAGKSNCKTQEEYMRFIFHDSIFDDPILKFHQLHGARVLGLIPNYRPGDIDNQGYGVLVKYDIKKRPWSGTIAKKKSNRAENAHDLFLRYISKKVGKTEIKGTEHLKDIGFDSLDMTELLIYVNEKLGISLSMSDMDTNDINTIVSLMGNDSTKKQEPLKKRIRSIMRKYPELVPLSIESENKLIFWIHPMSGDVGIYSSLSARLGADFRMVAVKACGLLSKTKEPITSVIEMAGYYCDILELIDPKGPYNLAGFSFGGTIAYEMTCQLEKRGKKVSSLVMIESPYVQEEDRYLFNSSYRNNAISNANFLLVSSEQSSNASMPVRTEITDSDIADVDDQHLISVLADKCREKGVNQNLDDICFKIGSMSDVHNANLKAIRSYSPSHLEKPSEVSAWLIRTEDADAVSNTISNPEYLKRIQREKGSMLPLLEGWKNVFSNLHTITLKGRNHIDIFHFEESIDEFCSIFKNIYSSSKQTDVNFGIPAIAVIGMSGRFPDAENTDIFWENLKNGVCSIRKAPEDRGWKIDDYYAPVKMTPGKTYSRAGGFLKNVDLFDPLFFKMTVNDAELTDPSERIFLEEAWRAIEDAGYSSQSISGKKWGVFACAKGDYPLLIEKEIGHHYMPTDSYSASRLSYLLNLTGPAMTVDTACSSTAAAIALACSSIASGECEAAIAGGAGIYSTPDIFIGSSQSLLLSSDDTCRAFDKKANGTVIAESAGAFILKSLKRAEEDNDHIYGVIRGWGMNQDGRTNGITAPNGMAQSMLQTEVYDKFHIDPGKITMIEAHGTGTKLGDAIEYQALLDSFSKYTDKKRYCALCSVKTNIGHAFFGSGVAGMAKVLLAMKNKQIPPLLNFEETIPDVDINSGPFYITTKLREWKPDNGEKRIAAINSFGATGTNVHMVIEEYEGHHSYELENAVILFVLSARNKDRLMAYTGRMLSYFERNECDSQLQNVAFTLQTGREPMEERLAFVAETVDEIRKKLKSYINNSADDNLVLYGNKKHGLPGEKKKEADLAVKTLLEKFRRNRSREILEKLAEHWVQGTVIDWQQLYSGEMPEKISLPGYPFAEERCWVNTNHTTKEINISSSDERAVNDFKAENNSDMISDDIFFYKEELFEKTLTEISGNNEDGFIFLLSEQDNTDRVKKYFRSFGKENVIIISQAASTFKASDEHYYIQKDDTEGYLKIFSEIAAYTNKKYKIVYSWQCEDYSLCSDYGVITHIIKAIHKSRLNVEVLLLNGCFRSASERCFLDSWIGFERSLRCKFRVKVLINNEKDNAISLDIIVKELENGNNSESAVWISGKRYVYGYTSFKPECIDPVIKEQGIYLITGGMGGIGQVIAAHLAKKYHAFLVLTGRSAFSERISEKCEMLNDIGGKAVYIQADITNLNEMQKVLNEVEKHFGSVNGIIHTAGKVDPSRLLDKDLEQMERVISPKIKGINVIDKVLGNRNVDFICCFSSSSSIFGDFEFCDYSIANRYLNAYSRYCSSNRRNIISICWPLWRNGSMGMGDEVNKLYLDRTGQKYIENEDGAAVFEALAAYGSNYYLVIKGNENSLELLSMKRNIDSINGLFEDKADTVLHSEEKERLIIKSRLKEDLRRFIYDIFAIDGSNIKDDANLIDYGIDSIKVFSLAQKISSEYSIDATSGSIINCFCLNDIVEKLVTDHYTELSKRYPAFRKDSVQIKTDNINIASEIKATNLECEVYKNNVPVNESIAVIGISGVFPDSDDLDELWSNLSSQKSCIRKGDVRWKDSDTAKYSGYVNDVYCFDAEFFGVSEENATLIPPCHRILLQESWKAVEDAGYNADMLKNSNCGVFVGCEENDYSNVLLLNGKRISSMSAEIPAMISNHMDLRGPSCMIDTSCSSGMTALHNACLMLRAGECDTALVGGAALLCTSGTHDEMDSLGILSSDGKMGVYDENGDGMIASESVVVLMLKPLSKAKADHDYIYGCITECGTNHNSRSTVLSAPDQKSEAELIQKIIDKAGIAYYDIQYILGHSVGTRICDISEVNALKTVFRQTDGHRCWLSSVKNYIGHTFAASGLVNIAVMLKAMNERRFIGSPEDTVYRKEFDLSGSSLYFLNKNTEWMSDGSTPRMGLVCTSSNSGVNSAALICEYVDNDMNDECCEEYVIPFSAPNKEGLIALLTKYRDYLKRNSSISLTSLSYVLQTGRKEYSYRTAFIVSSIEELINEINNHLNTGSEKVGKVVCGYVDDDLHSAYSALLDKYEELSVSKMLEKRDALALSLYWIEGKKINWSSYYNRIPHKIPLPSYVFKKNEYRVEITEKRKNPVKHERARLEDEIINIIASVLDIDKGCIATDRSLEDYINDSITLRRLIIAIEERMNVKVRLSELRSAFDIRRIIELIKEKYKENVPVYNEGTEVKEEYLSNNIIELIERFEKGQIGEDQFITELGVEEND